MYFRKYHIFRKSVEWVPSCSMQTSGHTDRHDEADCRLIFESCAPCASHMFLISNPPFVGVNLV